MDKHQTKGPVEINITDEAVEAAAKAVYGGDHLDGSIQRDAWLRDFRIALEAAAPHLLAGVEWGVFRASDAASGSPIENLRYKSREAAQRSIDKGFLQPEFWEVRGRAVGEWAL